MKVNCGVLQKNHREHQEVFFPMILKYDTQQQVKTREAAVSQQVTRERNSFWLPLLLILDELLVND